MKDNILRWIRPSLPSPMPPFLRELLIFSENYWGWAENSFLELFTLERQKLNSCLPLSLLPRSEVQMNGVFCCGPPATMMALPHLCHGACGAISRHLTAHQFPSQSQQGTISSFPSKLGWCDDQESHKNGVRIFWPLISHRWRLLYIIGNEPHSDGETS